jgi:hypothetical protein
MSIKIKADLKINLVGLQALMDMIYKVFQIKIILLSNNKKHRLYKVIYSMYLNFMKGFKFNQIVYKIFILNKYKGIFKKEKIKILTGLLMDLSHLLHNLLVKKLLIKKLIRF